MNIVRRTALSIIAMAVTAMAISGIKPAMSGEVYKIRQIMDLRALVPSDLYKFVPNYYWVESGDRINFLNSTGNHTVKSVKGIWPKGAETVDIANQESYDVKLTVPGVYGFRCKIHARHGMFALVVVDTPEPNLAEAKKAPLGDWARTVFDELLVKLEKDRKRRRPIVASLNFDLI
ncbi:MAG: hypothetical protein CMJ96_01590 [Planctomycetes bacterium]|jgi:pseudoazurin|nr:hypothetical protein [Planctomycetota bacterium]|tara:strand:+ start:267 stop:794 length:528 start_codon:yes stop_codon:yes gene_type:complete